MPKGLFHRQVSIADDGSRYWHCHSLRSVTRRESSKRTRAVCVATDGGQKKPLQNGFLSVPFHSFLRQRSGSDSQHRRGVLAASECLYSVAAEDKPSAVRRKR